MEPVRTCVGCRARAAKTELLRLTVVAGFVRLDRSRHAPGRGVYLHRHADCWDKAVGRRALPRALRAPQADGSRLLNELAEFVHLKTATA